MDNQSTRVTIMQILAFFGAANCIVVPFLFVAGQSPLWPLPGLYMVEIALLGLAGFLSVMKATPQSPKWMQLTWIVAGCLLAFVILGAWTIGLFLLPATVIFLFVGTLNGRQLAGELRSGLTFFFLAALVQARVILVVLWLEPVLRFGS